jgi:hypothetical protein
MPIDPSSIAVGKSYITATRHLRRVLEITNERVRYAYGGGDAGGAGQWRWQTKAKFAHDAVGETSSYEALTQAPARTQTEKQENTEPLTSEDSKSSGSRKILKRRV